MQLLQLNSDHVNIVGRGSGWEDSRNNNGDTWGVIPLILYTNDMDVLFDLHNFSEKLEDNKLENQKYIHIINGLNIPLIVRKKVSYIPSSVEYPVKKICDKFKSDYFTCSIPYMIAYALYLGVKKIDFWGVSLTVGTEYYEQKPSAEFWIGYARGMGVEVNIHGFSELLKSPNKKIYAYNKEQKRYGDQLDSGIWFDSVKNWKKELEESKIKNKKVG